MSHRIFISYKRVDKARVFKIRDFIERQTGVSCWIDLDGIESDAQFKDVIIKAIKDADIMLFMYSKAHSRIAAIENDWTIKELNFAFSKGKRVVFVNLDGAKLIDRFEFDFGIRQQVDANDPVLMNKLVRNIKRWLGVKGKKEKTGANDQPPKTKILRDKPETNVPPINIPPPLHKDPPPPKPDSIGINPNFHSNPPQYPSNPAGINPRGESNPAIPRKRKGLPGYLIALIVTLIVGWVIFAIAYYSNVFDSYKSSDYSTTDAIDENVEITEADVDNLASAIRTNLTITKQWTDDGENEEGNGIRNCYVIVTNKNDFTIDGSDYYVSFNVKRFDSSGEALEDERVTMEGVTLEAGKSKKMPCIYSDYFVPQEPDFFLKLTDIQLVQKYVGGTNN